MNLSSFIPVVIGDSTIVFNSTDIVSLLAVILLFVLLVLGLMGFYCRNRLEAARARSNRTTSLLGALGVRVAVIDAEGNYFFCHYRCALTSLPRSKLGTRSNPELLPENLALTRKVIESGVQEQANFSIEGDYFRAEVVPLPRRLYKAPTALWTIYNVTDLYVAQQEFSEYADWLNCTMDSVSDGIVVFDERGSVSYVNHVMTGFGGFRKTEVVGESMQRLFELCLPGDNSAVAEAVREVIATDRPSCDIDCRVVREDGSSDHYTCSARPLHDDGGRVNGAVMLMRSTNTEHALRSALKRECDNLNRIAKEHELTIANLNNYIEYAQIFGSSLAHLLTLSDMSNAIDSVLATAGRTVRADRAYVFEYSPDGRQVSNTHEWTTEGVTHEKNLLQNIPMEELARWTGLFQMRRIVQITDMDAPEIPEGERRVLLAQNIKSLIAIGINLDGRLSGFVGLDFVKSKRKFSYLDEQIMRDIANLLVCATERRRYLELKKAMVAGLGSASSTL